MYPRSFEYVVAHSKEEALDFLAERGNDVKILAGGQSLIPMMKLRFANPGTLLDINRIPGMGGIAREDGHIKVQALARHADVVRSDVIRNGSAAMASAAPWIADPIVRNLGTLCGSIAHHDPEGDWASVLLATGADVVVEAKPGVEHAHPGADGAYATGGQRVIPIEDFLVDMFATALHPTEMITEIRVPTYTRGGGDYQKLERKIGDYATVGVATHLELDDTDTITKAGIALTSVYAHNLKVTEAEQLLMGNSPSTELFAEAAQVAKNVCDPTDDVRGSAAYKRDVVRVFTERGLAASLEAARS